MNRAAEQAAGQVGSVFKNVIANITLADAFKILRGSDDAATQYLRNHSQAQLTARIEPIVANATASTGVTGAYKNLTAKAGPLLTVFGGRQTNLDAFVTSHALDGMFKEIAGQEAQIRANPAARTSEILRKVFGS